MHNALANVGDTINFGDHLSTEVTGYEYVHRIQSVAVTVPADQLRVVHLSGSACGQPSLFCYNPMNERKLRQTRLGNRKSFELTQDNLGICAGDSETFRSVKIRELFD